MGAEMKYIPSAICMIAAAYLAYRGIDGWGLFIAAGIILS